MHHYSAYQLSIYSKVELPELCSNHELKDRKQPQISIVIGHARRESVGNALVEGFYYKIQPETCWLEIPNICRFLIRQGREVIVEPFPGVDEDTVRLFIYTHCIPLVLVYHDYFLLHGSVIQRDEQAVAFLTNFGQGKSTLLASFIERNHPFLSDDFCVLNPDGLVMPAFPNIQLRYDALQTLNIDHTVLKRIRPKLNKWYVPSQQAFHSQPSPLKVIYIINPTNRLDLEFAPLVGLRKVQSLKKYTYHPLFVKGMGKDLHYFHQCAILAARTRVTYVERAKQGIRWHELAKIFDKDMQNKVFECQ